MRYLFAKHGDIFDAMFDFIVENCLCITTTTVSPDHVCEWKVNHHVPWTSLKSSRDCHQRETYKDMFTFIFSTAKRPITLCRQHSPCVFGGMRQNPMMTSSNRNFFRGEFPSQRPSTTRSTDVFFDVRLNKQLSKQSKRRWFETAPHLLWRHWNASVIRHLHPKALAWCFHLWVILIRYTL